MKLHCQVGNILAFPEEKIPQGAAHFAAFHWGESGQPFMWSLHLNAEAWQDNHLELGSYPFIMRYRAGFLVDTRDRITEDARGFTVLNIEHGLKEHFDPLAATMLAPKVLKTMETVVLTAINLARRYIVTRDRDAFTQGVRPLAEASSLHLEMPEVKR